jgi:hypothetical protein
MLGGKMWTMDRNQMREIAEAIARDPKSYPSARVSALRFLRELDDESAIQSHDEFAELDELAPRRRNKGS